MDYQLELKQIVDFPRCRIYREFIQTLIKDRSIRTNGSSCLFYFLILCSYANYSSSYRNIEHLTYTVAPGEWICTLKELQHQFRFRFQHQVLSVLDSLAEQNCLTYTLHEKNRIIRYKISDWPKDNTALSYNFPCKKDVGFFFFPIANVHKLIHMGKCSEMDALLDLWIHAVYNDPSVRCSDSGPVVYFRNQTGNPLFSYQYLAERWQQSKSSVSRMLKKLESNDMITLISYSGKHGSMIYLNNYLSVMFNISDVMIDKEEIAMKMELPIHIPDEVSAEKTTVSCVPESVSDEQIIVSQEGFCVPEPHTKTIVRKVAEMLETQGIVCCRCPKAKYILSPLSACKDIVYRYSLRIICPLGSASYHFELNIKPQNPEAKTIPSVRTQTLATSPSFSEIPEILLKGGE